MTVPEVKSIGQSIKSLMMSLIIVIVTTFISYLLSSTFPALGMQDNTITDTPDLKGYIKEKFKDMKFTPYESHLLAYIVDPSTITETFDDIGGLHATKEDIMMNIVIPLQNPSAFFSNVKCLNPSRGAIFIGAPGTGKTMVARAIAKESNVNFLCLTLASLENKYFGESSKLLAAVFSLAKKIQPCIIFFDEIDGMMRERSSEEQSCSYGFKTEFLTHMDGMRTNCSDAIIVIGCTNNLKIIDPALKRRLPKVYHMEKPNEKERLHILKLLMKNEPLHARKIETSTCDHVVANTEGYTGSDLSEIYRLAASSRLQKQLKNKQFVKALKYNNVERHILPLQKDDWQKGVDEMINCKNNANAEYCMNNDTRSTLDALINSLTKRNQSA